MRMKKKDLCWVAGALMLMACGSSGPKDALQKYLDAMQDKDFDTFVDGMNFGNEPSKEEKQSFALMLSEKADKKDGLKEFKVVSDSMLVEDSLAIVTYEVIYDDGRKDVEKQRMVKKDGKWLMDARK